MNLADLLFLAGGALAGAGPWFQVIKNWRSGKAEAPSYPALLGVIVGVWLIEMGLYMVHQFALLAMNGWALLAWIAILSQKMCARSHLICFRCGMAIKPGRPFIRARDGRRSHFGCVMSALGSALGGEEN